MFFKIQKAMIIVILWLFIISSMLSCGDSDKSEMPIQGDQSTTSPIDSGDIVQELEKIIPQQPEEVIPQQPEEVIPQQPEDDAQRFAIEQFEVGDKVIVQNTIPNHGLHVRDPAGLHLGDVNIIGHMLNGATGTIVDGHEVVNDLVWFEIKWDAIGKGECEINGRVPCVGWSAAVSLKGTRLLGLIK